MFEVNWGVCVVHELPSRGGDRAHHGLWRPYVALRRHGGCNEAAVRGLTGAIDEGCGSTGHAHETVVEFRCHPGIDRLCNRAIRGTCRRLLEDLLHLDRQ